MAKHCSFILLAFFFSGTQYSNAQSSLSDFLLTAFEDVNTQGYEHSINFLSPKNYRLPIVEDIEFRFGNDEFTNQDQQYALRFRPGNPWKIRRNNALFNATKKELNIRKRLQYKENLEDRYELASAYLLSAQLLEIQKKHYSIIAKRVEILGSNMESSLFDAKDFVEAKLDQVDALNSQEEAKVSMMRANNKIVAILQNTEFDWTSSPLISISTIDRISGNIISNEISSLELDLISQKIEVARREVRLEKADFDIGFFQTKYFPYKDRNSDYGISFGLSIPLFKSNKNQIAERKLDEIERKGELITEQYQDSVQRIIEYEYLKSLINQHRSLIAQIEQLDLERLSKNLSQIEDNNPLSLLQLQEGTLKLKELELKSYKRVIDQYLEFLSTFNVLTQQPLTNYLSEQLEDLE
tara:strand:- start:33219 stop:34451 length:1233 start_codon:yes stop_codon:yes gene_type:complete